MSKKKTVWEFDLDANGKAEMLRTDPAQVMGWKPDAEIYTEEQLAVIKNCLPTNLDKKSHEFFLHQIIDTAKQYQCGYKNDRFLRREAESFRDSLTTVSKTLEKLSSTLIDEIFKYPHLVDNFISPQQKHDFDTLLKISQKKPDFKFKRGAVPHDLQKFVIELAGIYADAGGNVSASGKETKKGYSVSPFIRFVNACALPVNKLKQYEDPKKMMQYVKDILKRMG